MREKVLYLSGFSPFFTEGGGNQRCHHILNALASRYDVDVVVDFDDRDSFTPPHCVQIIDIQRDTKPHYWERICRRLNLRFNPMTPEVFMPCNLWKYRQVHKLIRDNFYRYVVVRYFFMVSYYRLYHINNLVIDVDDLPAVKLQSTLRMEYGDLTKAQMRRVRQFERISQKVANMAVCNFLPDKKQLHLIPHSCYLPNIPMFPVKGYGRISGGNKVVFIGSMTQDMNFRGVDHFIASVWPLVKRQCPDIEFHIIGKGTPTEFVHKWQTTCGVKLRGFVDDIERDYAEAICAVAPIYSGAGTNIKVLEALAHKCPIVVTEFALRGFEDSFKDGVNISVADTDEDFADKIIRHIADAHYSEDMAQRGYDAVKRDYSFEIFNRLFHDGLDHIQTHK